MCKRALLTAKEPCCSQTCATASEGAPPCCTPTCPTSSKQALLQQKSPASSKRALLAAKEPCCSQTCPTSSKQALLTVHAPYLRGLAQSHSIFNSHKQYIYLRALLRMSSCCRGSAGF